MLNKSAVVSVFLTISLTCLYATDVKYVVKNTQWFDDVSWLLFSDTDAVFISNDINHYKVNTARYAFDNDKVTITSHDGSTTTLRFVEIDNGKITESSPRPEHYYSLQNMKDGHTFYDDSLNLRPNLT
jgi:hypothetical protein